MQMKACRAYFRFEEAVQARDIRARIFGGWDDADW